GNDDAARVERGRHGATPGRQLVELLSRLGLGLHARRAADEVLQLVADELADRLPDLLLAAELVAQGPAIDRARRRVVVAERERHDVVDDCSAAGRWRGRREA